MRRRRAVADLARRTGMNAIRAVNQVRRLTIRAHDAVRWVLDGWRDELGGEETVEAENFGNIGVTARPAADGSPEAIIVTVGGEAGHPVIVATRDHATEAAAVAAAGGLAAGETLVYGANAQVKLAADGAVHVGKRGGPFHPVALGDHRHPVGPLVVTFPQTIMFVPGSPPMTYAVTEGVLGGPITTGASDSNSSEVKVS